jgi:hypothetical protein
VSEIAISYRRADSAAVAGRIYDHLVAHYGAPRVYMDVTNIPAGVDFRKHIGSSLSKSKVLLVIIGPNWNPRGPNGQYRITEPMDSVHNEIEIAF